MIILLKHIKNESNSAVIPLIEFSYFKFFDVAF